MSARSLAVIKMQYEPTDCNKTQPSEAISLPAIKPRISGAIPEPLREPSRCQRPHLAPKKSTMKSRSSTEERAFLGSNERHLKIIFFLVCRTRHDGVDSTVRAGSGPGPTYRPLGTPNSRSR